MSRNRDSHEDRERPENDWEISSQDRAAFVSEGFAKDFHDRGHGVEWEFARGEPPQIEAFRACRKFSAGRTRDDGGVHELPQVAVVGVADRAAARIGEHPEKAGDLDIESGFFTRLANGSLGECFPRIQTPGGQAPPSAIGTLFQKDTSIFVENHCARSKLGLDLLPG